MRVATIDVGTNTVRLLVADVVGPASWTVVDQRQTVTRLGEGLAAACVLRGVQSGLPALAGRLVTFDIGGGSTEYILAEPARILAAVSLRLGVVPLAERFPFADGVDRDRYAALLAEVRGRLERELPPAIRGARVPHLVGTAGTVTTLAALDLDLLEYDPQRVQGHRLSRATVERLLRRLGRLSVAARAALPCLEPGRADLIIPGLAMVPRTRCA